MLLGVDVGTTNLKVAAYAPERGEIVAVVRRPTRTHRPRPGWAEFAAEELWQDTASAIRDVLGKIASTSTPASIQGIAIGSMGESGVLLDRHLQPLGPMIAWYDRRMEEQVAWWRAHVDPWAIYQITGQVLDAKFSVNQLLWFRQHHPQRFAAARQWLCVPDYLVWRLCGTQVTERSIASRTMLFDQTRQDWSAELLDQCGMPRELLPPVVTSGTCVGAVTQDAAAATGLRLGTPVVTGGHDHLVGALAAGVWRPGGVLDSTGTAAVVLQLVDAFAPNRRMFEAGVEVSSFTAPRTFAVLGSINLVGGAAEWLVRLLWGDRAEASTLGFAAAEAAPRGSLGAMWLPHFLGSGTPSADARSRAALVGVRPEHDRGHLLRALLESLGYWLRENLEVAVEWAGMPTEAEVVAIGGATRSAFWTQLKADVCGRTFVVPRLEESVALGAALLAGLGSGSFASLAEAIGSVSVDRERFVPRAEAAREYDVLYEQVYRRLYSILRDINATIETLGRVSE